MAFEFDLITLGAGSGGVAASRRAASHGARVAIIEGRRVGGTCVLRGCVPKKLLLYAAQFADQARDATGFGWQLSTPRFDMAQWSAAKAAETSRLEGIYRQLLATSGVTVLDGYGRLGAPNEVWVGDRRLTAEHILLATGSAPAREGIPGLDACATSDDLLDLTALPERAAIIGGGFIAVEFASMFARFGVEVSVFYRADRPLRGFDGMLRDAAVDALRDAGVALHPGAVPREITRDGAAFTVHLADGTTAAFPWVLNATGRNPNTQGLSVALDNGGAIVIDADLQTSRPGVWAVGDVTNRKNLTPVAIAEGRALANALFGPHRRRVDLSRVPSAVFLQPPLATVGPTEEELVAAGRPFLVFEANFRPMKAAFVRGQERTWMKLLVDAGDDRVLAVHMAGADAPEIVQSLAVALTAGATKADFDHTIAVHPTAAEEFVLMREPTRRWPPPDQG